MIDHNENMEKKITQDEGNLCSDGECSSGGEENNEKVETTASDKPVEEKRIVPPAERGILTDQPQQSFTIFPSGVTISS
jgi:hypothetical protein